MKKGCCTLLVCCLLFTVGCNSAGISNLPFGASGTTGTGSTEEGNDECKSQGMAMDRVLAAGVCGGGTYFILKKLKADEVQKWLGTATVSAGCWILVNNYQNQLCEERKKLKGHEKDLDARLVYAKNVNEKTKEYNQHIKTEVADIEEQIDKAQGDKDKLEKLNKQLTNLNEKIETDKVELVTHLDELQDYRKTISVKKESKEKVDELDAQIEELETELAMMDKEMERMASYHRKTRV
jgi:DNA repair exonuclease SbcCD ATPase subunit